MRNHNLHNCQCCVYFFDSCTFVFRYFGAARDLPGVRELFEQRCKCSVPQSFSLYNLIHVYTLLPGHVLSGYHTAREKEGYPPPPYKICIQLLVVYELSRQGNPKTHQNSPTCKTT